jgi:hypothetical protein
MWFDVLIRVWTSYFYWKIRACVWVFCELFEWRLLHAVYQVATIRFGFAFSPWLVVSVYHSLSLSFWWQRLVVRKLHFGKVGKAYNCLVFSTNLWIISCENYFMEGKTNLEHNYKHKCFIHKFSTNCMGRWFLTINMPISSI